MNLYPLTPEIVAQARVLLARFRSGQVPSIVGYVRVLESIVREGSRA